MGREHSIPVHRVAKGNIKRDMLVSQVRGLKIDGVRGVSMPFFISHNNGQETEGRIKRQCTTDYKIEPIHAFIKREVLGLKRGQRSPKEPVIESWRGISKDEVYRVRMSRERWSINSYPLIGIPFDYLDHPYTRQDCILWLREHFPERAVPRSSCLGCPFHSNAEWRRLKENPQEWADITEFDRSIRKQGGKRGDCYLHRSLIPIEDVDFRNAEDRGQLRLFNEECEGMCGV